MFSPEDDLQVVYPKPKVLTSDSETLKNIKEMLDLGLIEEWEKFIKMDPNLSEQDAMDKLERIEKRREEKARKMLGGMNANKQITINQESEIESEGSESGREE